MTEASEWDVEVTEEAPGDEREPQLEYEIMNYPADITLSGYVDHWNKGEMIVPDFQRDYVWDRVKASKLIESFLLGLPVPGTFLYKQKTKPGYLIIDGQQRITSVVRFIKGTFGEAVFRLKNVNTRYEGKSFEELSDDDQFKIRSSILRATIIQQINPNDDTSIYQIFERLNTGGVNLNPMEVRQCVSYGPFVKVLKALNRLPEWRAIIGQPSEDKRLRDVELVLRSLALSEWRTKYEKPMKGFLNKYMEHCRDGDQKYDEINEKFEKAAKFIVYKLGEKPFHVSGRLNYGALDSVMAVAISGVMPDDIFDRYRNLLNDVDYINSIKFNTSDEAVVAARLAKASQYFT